MRITNENEKEKEKESFFPEPGEPGFSRLCKIIIPEDDGTLLNIKRTMMMIIIMNNKCSSFSL